MTRVFPLVGLAVLATSLGTSDLLAQDAPRAEPKDLVVRCVDEAGKPVEDAEVWLFEIQRTPAPAVKRLGEAMRTDRDGCCPPVEVRTPPSWLEHWAYARVPGKLVGAKSGGLFSDGRGFEVRMVPSRRVSGTVHTSDIVDATKVRVLITRLHAEDEARQRSATAARWFPTLDDATVDLLLAELERIVPGRFVCSPAADGTFHLEEVPSVLLDLEASGPGVARAGWSGPASSAAKDVGFGLVLASVFRGTLTAPDGTAAAGAKVTLHLEMKDSIARRLLRRRFCAEVGADGRFSVDGLPAGAYVVEVVAAVGCRYPQRLALAVGELRLDEVVQLEVGVEVGGVVLAADDRSPVPDVAITIAAEARRFAFDTVLARTRSDANGRFVVRVPTGPSWLTAQPRRLFNHVDPMPIDQTRPAAELRQLEVLLSRK